MTENGQKFEVEAVSPLESDKLIEIAQQAEKRIEAVKKIKTMALRLTNSHDWVDQGGKPYLQVSGSEKVARLFGISWRFLGDIQRKDEERGHFSFEVSMEFIMTGASIEFRGSRSSKDPFFSKKYGRDIPPSEIDKTDVMKAAITNTIGNGITRLLGIRNLTWDDLKEGNIKQEDVGKVDYKKKETQPKQNGTGNKISVAIEKVEKKTGSKDGKSWTLYIIHSGEKSFNTFDKNFADLAEEAASQKINSLISFSETPKGLKLESIELEPPIEASEES